MAAAEPPAGVEGSAGSGDEHSAVARPHPAPHQRGEPGDEPLRSEDAGTEDAGTEDAGTEDAGTEGADTQAADGEPAASAAPGPRPAGGTRGRRPRDRVAGALIGVLTLLLGFAFAVQVRSTDTDQQLAGAREEDLVRILDDLNAREDRLRQQISEQRTALDQLNSSDSQSATALQEARQRAQAIGILNGTIAAQGPGLRITIRDPQSTVRVADLLDAVEELRGAGAETMQIDDVRVGVSTAVTGEAGALALDGHPLAPPYTILVIGSPQNLQTALNIPGGVVQRITGRGGSVDIVPEQQVVVDALRPLDRPQYASPKTGG